jgi:uncharacterized protein
MKFKLLLSCAAIAVCCVSAQAGPAEDLRLAAINNSARTITQLTARGTDVNAAYENGYRAVHFAAAENSPEALAALLKIPSLQLDVTNALGETALMLAIIRGHRGIVDALLAAGAQVNKPGWAPLHYAASVGNDGLVKLLLDKYAFIDAQSPNGTTPLMMAARHGHTSTAQRLVAQGADVLMKNEQGMSARDFAIRHEHKNIAEQLAVQEQTKRRQRATEPSVPAVDLNLPEHKDLCERLLGPDKK